MSGSYIYELIEADKKAMDQEIEKLKKLISEKREEITMLQFRLFKVMDRRESI